MKRLVIAGALASLVAWTGAAAQTEKPQETKGKQVTLTGCLAKGDTADSFTLTNATMAGEKAGTTGEKAGATSAQGKTYHLSPGKAEKMEAHVGHIVEITGTLGEPREKSAKPTTEAPAAGSTPKTTPAMQHVTVIAMKHVSPKCS